MISTIVAICLIIITVVLTIIKAVSNLDKDEADNLRIARNISLGLSIFFSGIMVLSLLMGSTPDTEEVTSRYTRDKIKNEKLLEECPVEYLTSFIDDSEAHNINIEFGNNLWCRFSIKDMSEYKIDINKILEKRYSQ